MARGWSNGTLHEGRASRRGGDRRREGASVPLNGGRWNGHSPRFGDTRCRILNLPISLLLLPKHRTHPVNGYLWVRPVKERRPLDVQSRAGPETVLVRARRGVYLPRSVASQSDMRQVRRTLHRRHATASGGPCGRGRTSMRSLAAAIRHGTCEQPDGTGVRRQPAVPRPIV